MQVTHRNLQATVKQFSNSAACLNDLQIVKKVWASQLE